MPYSCSRSRLPPDESFVGRRAQFPRGGLFHRLGLRGGEVTRLATPRAFLEERAHWIGGAEGVAEMIRGEGEPGFADELCLILRLDPCPAFPRLGLEIVIHPVQLEILPAEAGSHN